jgi:hypothetical protein
VCGFKGYLLLREGEGKTLHQQYHNMEKFFHSDEGKCPSQIKMMAKGVGCYKELYEEKKKSVTSCKGGSSKKISQT